MTVEFFILLAALIAFVIGPQILNSDLRRPGRAPRGPHAADEYDPDAEDEQVLWIGPVSGSPMMNRSVTSRAQYLSNKGSGGRL